MKNVGPYGLPLDSLHIKERIRDIRYTSIISPAQITTQVNDYYPPGIDTAYTLRLNGNMSQTITGIAGGQDGRTINIENVGTSSIVLAHASGSSQTQNQFLCPGSASVTLTANQGCVIMYDATSSAWRVLYAGGMSNPMTTTGDIIYSSDNSGTPARLGIGASTSVLHGGAIPSYSPVNLATDVSGTLGITNGGTNFIGPLNGNRVMVSTSTQIIESNTINDGESVQRNNNSFISAPLPLHTVEGRLTLTSGTPVTTSDVTSAGTIFFTPYKGNRLYLYDGTRWKLYSFSELSLSLTITSGNNYDVFVFDNSGTLTLELSAAWANNTTRTDALTTQNGVLLKSSATTRRYLGTIRANGANTTADSGGGTSSQVGGQRFVYNYYNRVKRPISVIDTTNSWSYTTSAFRIADGVSSPSNCIEFVIGGLVNEDDIHAEILEAVVLANNSAQVARSAVGVDSGTTPSGIYGNVFNGSASLNTFSCVAVYDGFPGIGYHFLSWLEGGADGTSSFRGNNGGLIQSGLSANIFS